MNAPRKPPRERSSWRSFASGPKVPPPAHGIRIRTVGTTWWGMQWIAALVRISPDYASRLERGKTYARGGRVHDLLVAAGQVTARVTGSRPEPYAVTITLPPLGDETWEGAIARLAGRARFAAELLAGVMPKDVDDAFEAAGASLFPGRGGELGTTCSCPDWANPCKHVAATHYVLGDAFDRDPFLLFELRGQTREAVLARTKQARKAARGGKKRAAPPAEDAGRTGVVLTAGEDDYDSWQAPPPSLTLTFVAPAKHAPVLAALGLPASWREKASPGELVTRLVHNASTFAVRAATAPDEAEEHADRSQEPM
ncbi:MAG: hypothetical protein JWP97_3131 [Labilithrix sp.]|nr:hypothetical protein [Labilithrix sp.]